jgi:hypothetical protein
MIVHNRHHDEAADAQIRRVLRPNGQAWIYDLRPVLHRLAENATPRNLPVTLEALQPDPSAYLPARLLTAVAGRLINRLTVTP